MPLPVRLGRHGPWQSPAGTLTVQVLCDARGLQARYTNCTHPTRHPCQAGALGKPGRGFQGDARTSLSLASGGPATSDGAASASHQNAPMRRPEAQRAVSCGPTHPRLPPPPPLAPPSPCWWAGVAGTSAVVGSFVVGLTTEAVPKAPALCMEIHRAGARWIIAIHAECLGDGATR